MADVQNDFLTFSIHSLVSSHTASPRTDRRQRCCVGATLGPPDRKPRRISRLGSGRHAVGDRVEYSADGESP
jgi:hypothetical protein